ncbi:hypothetical protein HG531_008901 [Fusarium graminearum]|nr:hypothetical protein HG531_008901 [Fusarium graminearum]
MLVVDLVSSSESDGVVLWGETVDTDVVELELGTSSNEGPSGLVVVMLGGIDNGDVVVGEFTGSEKLVADGETSRASSDNDDLVAPSSGGDSGSSGKTSSGLAKDGGASSH